MRQLHCTLKALTVAMIPNLRSLLSVQTYDQNSHQSVCARKIKHLSFYVANNTFAVEKETILCIVGLHFCFIVSCLEFTVKNPHSNSYNVT